MAVLLGVLLLPRRAAPDDVPVPIANASALARARATDHDLAAHARDQPLSGPVRALGSAIRDYHTLEGVAEPAAVARARQAIDEALAGALPEGDDALLRLRAVQLEGFLAGLRAFESRGVESDELIALGGRFVAALTAAGWCDEHTLVPTEPALRTMFKEMWNSLVGLQGKPAFQLSLDEERALYALYLEHPHPSPGQRAAIEAARLGAHDARACEGVRRAEIAATEDWRLQRIARFEAIDPSYPAAFARGVASYHRGDYRASTAAFRAWLSKHPDGPYALRAQSFLRAAAAEVE
jgi:hypothetical protein